MRLISSELPRSGAIFSTQILLTIGAALALHGRYFKSGSSIVFIGSLLLDGWHNGFGFVNVRIHVIWFAGFMIFGANQNSKNEDQSSLALRCMELVLVLAYIQSGLNKFLHGGLDWILEGSTLQIGLIRQGIPIGVWVAQFPALMPVMSALAVAMELSFFLYFFIPRLAPWLLLSSILFHFSTWLLMGIDFSHLWIFSLSLLIFRSKIALTTSNLKRRTSAIPEAFYNTKTA